MGGAFHYLYDFGDGWEHRLIVEATGLKETNPCPRLIDGAMACPPEDIGGTVGYTALKVAAAGEKDVYGQELLEAMDGEFAPEALDEDEIADMLEPFQAGFRRLGSAPRKPRPARAQPLDMEASLKAQGIHSIEELMQVLRAKSTRIVSERLAKTGPGHCTRTGSRYQAQCA